MTDSSEIAGIASLTRDDFQRVSASLKLVFKLDDEPRFADLLEALNRVQTEANQTALQH